MGTNLSGTASFWNAYANQTPFLDKAEAVKNGTVFEIQGVSESTSQFGPQWVVNVVDTETNVAGKISFTRNPNRDEKMKLLQFAIEQGEIIDAKLTAFKNKNGQTGYDFAPVEDTPSDAELSQDVPF